MIAFGTILVGLLAVFYFIRLGKKITKADMQDRALRDVSKIYKIDKEEDEQTESKIKGEIHSSDSIASAMPRLRNPSIKRRNL